MTTAYNPHTAQDAPPSRGTQFWSMPKELSQSVDLKTGVISKSLWRYLWSFSSQPVGENAVILGTTPTVYTATKNGTLMIQGGAISQVTIGRVSTYTIPPAGTGYIPISIGDVITIYYTVAPTVTFFPR